MKYCCLIFCLLYNTNIVAQPKTDTLLQNMLLGNSNPIMQKVLKEKDSFRLQVIYTQINRDRRNKPSFKN
ncbi:MAG TPA: hypothetical protein PLA68_14185, partial [Panacibacter sp.]|nr:hypothetical protein [Panacibacter sp.]